MCWSPGPGKTLTWPISYLKISTSWCLARGASQPVVHLLSWTWLKPISVWLLRWDLWATCVPSNVIISRNTWGCWWVMMGHLGRVRTRAIMTMTGHSHFYYRALWCGIRTHSNRNVFIKVFIWFVNLHNSYSGLLSDCISCYQSVSCELLTLITISRSQLRTVSSL